MTFKHLPISVKGADPSKRQIQVIASHERVDADGEVVKISGIDLSRYSSNPIVLDGHDPSQPVGHAIALTKTTIAGFPAILAIIQFPHDPDSDRAYEKVLNGLLPAVSIGFKPLSMGPPELPGQEGRTFLSCQLLEISLVTIPSCETCLVTSKSAQPRGLTQAEVVQTIKDTMGELTRQAFRVHVRGMID